MKEASGKINSYAVAVEDCQTAIRDIIKQAFLNHYTREKTRKLVNDEIRKAVKDIKIARLRGDSIRSLINFADKQIRLWQSMGIPAELLLFLGHTATNNFVPTSKADKELQRTTAQFSTSNAIGKNPLPTSAKASAKGGSGGGASPTMFNKGVPLQQYYKSVWEDKVLPTIKRIMEEVALDPNDYTGRNSLRNLAEMEVRYQDHQDTIEGLKERGVKLVIASSHADCSDRCAEWQGRIYSLDGTSGEIDGKKYVPLEVATDHYYTTKAGRTYKNGLLGFNCRHTLTEYVGQIPPTISKKKREKEYAITQEQRRLERAVRRAKVKAMTTKGIDKQAYQKAQAQAKELYKQYVDFSMKNNRAFYPMRVAI